MEKYIHHEEAILGPEFSEQPKLVDEAEKKEEVRGSSRFFRRAVGFSEALGEETKLRILESEFNDQKKWPFERMVADACQVKDGVIGANDASVEFGIS